MAIDVSPNTQANRDESPTNPKFADSSISNGDLMAVIIQTHPSGNPIFTIGSELSNKANTKGFRIKHDTDGSNLLTLSSFGTIDYFVLIHSHTQVCTMVYYNIYTQKLTDDTTGHRKRYNANCNLITS